MNADETVRAGLAAEESGDLIGAAAAFESLLDHENSHVIADARFQLGRIRWRQGRWDEALALCQEARGMAVRLGANELRAKVDNAIGVLHYSRGEYAQARAAYAAALELTTEPVTRAKIMLNLGVIANIEGRLHVALQHYERARSMFRQAADERGEALALHNMGMLHADAAEWDEADEALRYALTLFERHGNRQMIANVLVNRSEVQYGHGRTDDAIHLCDLALPIYAEIGDEAGRAEALRWKGRGLRLLKLHGQAQEVLGEALRIAERMRARLLEAETLRELGATSRDQGDMESALGLLQRALASFVMLGAERDADDVRREIADLMRPR